jgi:hypothetical protein
MSVALLKLALLATGLVAAFLIVSAAPPSASSIAFPSVQNSWSAYMARMGIESQGGSYIRLAGATVRDHRSNSGGTYNTNTTPLSAVSPGFGEGGVGHTTVGGNPRDHRRCITGINIKTGQPVTICGRGN